MDGWKDRLIEEREQLKGRAEKLRSFIISYEFEDLQKADRRLLREQFGHMRAYLGILDQRAELIQGDEKTSEESVDTGNIHEFANANGLEVEFHVREHEPESSPCRYMAKFRRVDELEGQTVRFIHGNGGTKEDALQDYAEKISEKVLVLKEGTEDERVFRAWKFSTCR